MHQPRNPPQKEALLIFCKVLTSANPESETAWLRKCANSRKDEKPKPNA